LLAFADRLTPGAGKPWDDAAEAAFSAAQAEQMKIMEDRAEAIQAFLEKGLKAAGYTDEDLDNYLPFFDPDRIEELMQRSLIGCGRLDFFSVARPAAAS